MNRSESATVPLEGSYGTWPIPAELRQAAESMAALGVTVYPYPTGPIPDGWMFAESMDMPSDIDCAWDGIANVVRLSFPGTITDVDIETATWRCVLYRTATSPFEATIALDFGEPVDDFPPGLRGPVAYLRSHGRYVLADRIDTMVKDMGEAPDAVPINVVSLADMARLFVERQDFADPSVGSDRRGIIHTEWRIAGNGVLVWGFLGGGEILAVAQADATPDQPAIDLSGRGAKDAILERFACFVPLRS